jgi:glycosyltransferase involved in cell wall biosynthesis
MHILLIHQAFAAINEPGGTRHHELALYMACNGHRVTIVTSPISYLTGKNAGVHSMDAGHERVRIIRPRVYEALHRSFAHRILNFISFMVSSFWAGLRIEDVDLVWGTTPPLFQGVTAWALARLKRVPFLFEVRDLWPAFAVAVGVLNNNILIKASEWLERRLYKAADHVVINSPGFRTHVESRGGKQVSLVPNGADVGMFHPEERGQRFRRNHQLEEKYLVLYAGAHGMSNDLNVLLEAAILLRDLDNLGIVLLGDGKEKANLKAKAEELRLKNVHFISPVPKDEMSAALAAADACVAILKPIELYKTVYPNKVFDYMAAGRPVILAIGGVIRDVVEAAGAGMAVSPGDPRALADAIRVLEANRQKGRVLGKNGREYVEKYFDRTILAAKLTKIMTSLIESEG